MTGTEATAATEAATTDAAATEAARPVAYCERCGRETAHIIKQTEPDGTTHDVCWKCVSRVEKRFNVKESWKRGGRARSRQA